MPCVLPRSKTCNGEDLNPLEETAAILHLLAIALDIPVEEVPSQLYRQKNARQKNLNSEPLKPGPSKDVDLGVKC